jgi:branched-chain amino acid aminotransferase
VSAPGPRTVWVNGRLRPADEAHLSVFDRGFQLGDGVFETLRARSGRTAELDEHLARLRRSADGLAIPLPDDLEVVMARAIVDLLAAEGLDGPDGDASIRITASRGSFRGRGLLPLDEHVTATLAVQAWPVPPPPAGHLERGLSLVPSAVRRDPENPLAALKTTSRADYVFARLEARRAGADDALFLTTDGFLSEATSANVFLVRVGTPAPELATPALECAILPGTTRGWILAWAGRVGLAPVEAWLTTSDLASAEEAFLSSSVAGILPVTSFAGRAIGDGMPGPWTRRARADREAYLRDGP